MSENDAFENERRGAIAGLNPMFGDWLHRFRFAPVPYGDGGAKRSAFRTAIQSELPNLFFYSGEVKVEITLHLDVQNVLETSDTADLDNYAKSILDGLKGPRGVLFDDNQVQTLIISWIDTLNQEPHFDVSISGSPDDFMLKPVAFYEMPDGLWHPHSRRVWSDGTAEELPDRDHYMNLRITEAMAIAKKSGRHEVRKTGLSRLQARQRLLPISAFIRGFHKSRIDAEFEMCDQTAWHAALDQWGRDHPAEAREFEHLIAGVAKTYTLMTQALTGKQPE